MSHDEFAGADAGSSHTFPVRCSALRKGGHVILNKRPCKVVELSTARPGKHGHAKVRIIGRDLFSQRKYEGISPSTHNIDVPYVQKKDYQVLGVGDRYMSLLDDRGQVNRDITVPDGELGVRVRDKFDKEEDFMVTVLLAMDEGVVIGIKDHAG